MTYKVHACVPARTPSFFLFCPFFFVHTQCPHIPAHTRTYPHIHTHTHRYTQIHTHTHTYTERGNVCVCVCASAMARVLHTCAPITAPGHPSHTDTHLSQRHGTSIAHLRTYHSPRAPLAHLHTSITAATHLDGEQRGDIVLGQHAHCFARHAVICQRR